MRIISFLSIFFLVGLTACKVEVKPEEIDQMIFGYSRGVIAGIDVGDTWDYVKENHNDFWNVREDHYEDGISVYQLRKDWEEGYNYSFLGFELDENERIQEMEYTLMLSNDNKPLLEIYRQKIIADFNLITASNEMEKWKYYGPDGQEYAITLTLNEINEETSYLNVMVLKSL